MSSFRNPCSRRRIGEKRSWRDALCDEVEYRQTPDVRDQVIRRHARQHGATELHMPLCIRGTASRATCIVANLREPNAHGYTHYLVHPRVTRELFRSFAVWGAAALR